MTWALGVVVAALALATEAYCAIACLVPRTVVSGWVGGRFVSDLMDDYEEMRKREQPLYACVYIIIAVLSSPLGYLLHTLLRAKPREVRQSRIDAWHSLWLVASLLALFVGVGSAPGLCVLPVLKVVDVFGTMIMLMAFPERTTRSARPILHLAVHYLQLVTTFACLLLAMQGICGDRAFLADGCPSRLSPTDALYLSVVSATTLGFGDIVPRKEYQLGGFPALCHPAIVVELEVMLAIGLTVLFIPYFVGASANRA